MRYEFDFKFPPPYRSSAALLLTIGMLGVSSCGDGPNNLQQNSRVATGEVVPIVPSSEDPRQLDEILLRANEKESIAKLLKVKSDKLPELNVMLRLGSTIVMSAEETIPLVAPEDFALEVAAIEMFVEAGHDTRSLEFFDSRGQIKTKKYKIDPVTDPRYIIFADKGLITESTAPHIRSYKGKGLAVITQPRRPISSTEETMHNKNRLINLLGVFANIDAGSTEKTKRVREDVALGIGAALVGASFEEYRYVVRESNDILPPDGLKRLGGIISPSEFRKLSALVTSVEEFNDTTA